MKKTLIALLVLSTLFACKNEPKNYATISGKITNQKETKGTVQSRTYKKEIKISEDGTFSDTLHLKEKGQLLTFSNGTEYATVYLKNGDDIHLTLDAKEFDETLKFTGKGAENNNYLAQKSLLQEKLFTPDLFNLKETEFKEKVNSIVSQLNENLSKVKKLDTVLVNQEKKTFSSLEKMFLREFNRQKLAKEIDAKLIGKPSPTFNYENHKGGKTSLEDLKGKYVYVDVWATWCGPCKAEIPFLKKLEKKYHGKNITIVSISIDKVKDYDKWRKFVTEKQLGGVQLFADKDWKSDFVTAYGINGIPRFILIDPKGNVVKPNAPRPSNPKLIELLSSLGI